MVSPSSEDVRDRSNWQAGLSATILSTLLTLLPRSEAFALLEPAHETPAELTIEADTAGDTNNSGPQQMLLRGTDEAVLDPAATESDATSEITQPEQSAEHGEADGSGQRAVWADSEAPEITYTAIQSAAPAEATSQAHGSSTSPSLLFNVAAAVTAAVQVAEPQANAPAATNSVATKTFSSIDESIVLTATAQADVLTTDVKGATFAFVGPASAENFDVYVDTAGGATADFSRLAEPSHNEAAEQAGEHHNTAATTGDEAANDVDSSSSSETTGIYVDLSAASETRETAVGTQTVQAWTIDEQGHKDVALAHLEGVDNVVTTAGADVLVGNANANTYVYTPTPTPATHDTDHNSTDNRVATPEPAHTEPTHTEAGTTATTPAAEHVDLVETVHSAPVVAAEAPVVAHAVDVYSGGSDAAVTAVAVAAATIAAAVAEPTAPSTDNNDTADFSRVETGIKVDLAAETAITIADVDGADNVTIKGAMVSSLDAGSNHDGSHEGSGCNSDGQGGGEDIALLAYTTDGGEEQCSIENLVGSKGADILLGDSSDNTFVFVSTSAVASYFDGRGGSDKADFGSRNSDDDDGINVDLSNSVDGFADAEGNSHDGVIVATNGKGTTLVGLKNIENVNGTSHADIMVGDGKDNTFTGGGGGDTFVFRLLSSKGGNAGLGHDIVTDFKVSLDIEHDRIVFSDALLNLDSQALIDDKINKLMHDYAHDTADGLMFSFDDDSSVLLAGVHMDDFMGSDHSLSLSKYDYFFFS